MYPSLQRYMRRRHECSVEEMILCIGPGLAVHSPLRPSFYPNSLRALYEGSEECYLHCSKIIRLPRKSQGALAGLASG